MSVSASLYEQFLAVGSVKSLLTGKEYPQEDARPESQKPSEKDASSTQDEMK